MENAALKKKEKKEKQLAAEKKESGFIHLVSVDGPDPNKPIENENEADKKKLPSNNDIINSILVPKKVPKYYPPRKMVNPFEEAQQEQEKILQAKRDAS